MSEIQEFYEKVNELIKIKGVTQEWICKNADINLGTFRNRQTNGTYPNLLEGAKIAKLLDTNVEFLIFGKEADGMTAQEAEMLRKYKSLEPHDQNAINVLLKGLYEQEKGKL